MVVASFPARRAASEIRKGMPAPLAKPMQADPSRVPAQPPQEGQQEVAHQEEQGGEDLGAAPQHPLDADEEQPAEEGH